MNVTDEEVVCFALSLGAKSKQGLAENFMYYKTVYILKQLEKKGIVEEYPDAYKNVGAHKWRLKHSLHWKDHLDEVNHNSNETEDVV